MEEELYRILKERAEYFFKISKKDCEEGRYDIALFHIEQALQLALKAYLLREKGDFPRVHDLFTLIELADNSELNRLAEDKWYIVNILVDAYLGSRYFPRKYGKKEFEESLKFAEDTLRCLDILE